jgi:Skp family chaperone for outer membrane proteins
MRSLILVVFVSLAAQAQTTGADVKKQTKEAVDTSKQYLKESKDEFAARMEARLAELRAKTKALEKSTEADAKKKLAAIEKQEKAAVARLEAIKNAGGSAWKSLRAGVEQAVDDVENGLTGSTK